MRRGFGWSRSRRTVADGALGSASSVGLFGGRDRRAAGAALFFADLSTDSLDLLTHDVGPFHWKKMRRVRNLDEPGTAVAARHDLHFLFARRAAARIDQRQRAAHASGQTCNSGWRMLEDRRFPGR